MAARVALPREKLFRAADRLLATHAWSDISMAVLASAAGVSRQTLYNEFGTRDEFAQAWVLRETDRFVRKFEAAVDGARAPQAALQHAFAVFLREAARNPTVRKVVLQAPGSEELLALFTTRGGPVVSMATARLAAKLVERWPRTRAVRARQGAECLVRLAISHASLPSRSAAEVSRMVGELVGGFVVGRTE